MALDNDNIQNKIDALRNQTIDNGCTRAEAYTARTLLSKLQTKLNLANQTRAQATYLAAIHYTPTHADLVLQELRKEAQERARREVQHSSTWKKIKIWIKCR
jgi:hypothetical protein